MRYRKKPTVVDAKKWDGNAFDMLNWVNSISSEHRSKSPTAVVCGQVPGKEPFLEVSTLEGIMTANLGDYIICGIEGEFYFCKPHIFEKTYEVIE